MTQQQLQQLETELAKRGYKKYTKCLTSSESWAWFKSFDKQYNNDGETTDGYQVAFRVWDFTKYNQPEEYAYGFDVWTSALASDGRVDLTSNWAPICDIDVFERMAKDFHELTNKYLKA